MKDAEGVEPGEGEDTLLAGFERATLRDAKAVHSLVRVHILQFPTPTTTVPTNTRTSQRHNVTHPTRKGRRTAPGTQANQRGRHMHVHADAKTDPPALAHRALQTGLGTRCRAVQCRNPVQIVESCEHIRQTPTPCCGQAAVT